MHCFLCLIVFPVIELCVKIIYRLVFLILCANAILVCGKYVLKDTISPLGLSTLSPAFNLLHHGPGFRPLAESLATSSLQEKEINYCTAKLFLVCHINLSQDHLLLPKVAAHGKTYLPGFGFSSTT